MELELVPALHRRNACDGWVPGEGLGSGRVRPASPRSGRNRCRRVRHGSACRSRCRSARGGDRSLPAVHRLDADLDVRRTGSRADDRARTLEPRVVRAQLRDMGARPGRSVCRRCGGNQVHLCGGRRAPCRRRSVVLSKAAHDCTRRCVRRSRARGFASLVHQERGPDRQPRLPVRLRRCKRRGTALGSRLVRALWLRQVHDRPVGVAVPTSWRC